MMDVRKWGWVLICMAVSCSAPTISNEESSKQSQVDTTIKKKSTTIVIDSTNSSNFTDANTSGIFQKGQGSDKIISTEKPNRKRVQQDSTHLFYSPIEFVDETTDPAFNYSAPDQCETILQDSIR